MSDGAGEIRRLAADLSAVSAKMVGPMRAVFKESGDLLAQEWANNARATSGVHGKHYPNSIDADLRFSLGNIEAEVGPNAGKPQGRMGRGFEFGSVNQPPHLDGLKAVDKLEPLVEKAIEAAVADLIP